MKLEYTKDICGNDILQDVHEQYQVMMEWEKPYMEASIDFLNPKGDVLEIGFGLAYSASQIMKHQPKSYTVIECDPVVIQKAKEKFKEWAKDYPNTSTKIVEGMFYKKILIIK